MANLFEGLGPPIRLPEMIQHLEDRGLKGTAPRAKREATPLDAIMYRLHKGFQNNLVNNLIDSFSIATSQDSRLQRFAIRMQRQKSLQESHPEAIETSRKRGKEVGGIAGSIVEFLGANVDPTLAIPFGAYLGAARAARLGGSISPALSAGVTLGAQNSIDNALYQYVQGPRIKMTEVAVAGAIGGTIGGLLARIGGGAGSAPITDPTRLSNSPQPTVIDDPIQRGIMQPGGLLESPNKVAFRMGDELPGARNIKEVNNFNQPSKEITTTVIRELTENPNVTVGNLNDTLQAAGINLPKEILKDLSINVKAAKDSVDFRWAINGKDKTDIEKLTTLFDDPALVNFSDRVAMQKGWSAVEDVWKSATPGAKVAMKERFQQVVNQVKKNRPIKDVAEEEFTKIYNAQKKLENTTKRLTQTEPYYLVPYKSLDEYKKATNSSVAEVKTANENLNNLLPKLPETTYDIEKKVSDTYWKLADETGRGTVFLEDLKKALPDVPHAKIDETLKTMEEDSKALLMSHSDPSVITPGRVEAGIPDGRYGTKTAVVMERDLTDHAIKEATENLNKINKLNATRVSRQAGYVDPQLLRATALAAVGGTIGHGYDDENGAVVGAIIGGLLPWAMGKTIGKFSDWTANATPEGVGHTVGKYMRGPNVLTRPLKVLRRMGNAGKELAAKMEMAYDNVQLKAADVLLGYDKLRIRNSKGKAIAWTEEQGKQIADLIEGRIGPQGLHPNVIRTANYLKKEFAKIADEAVRLGIWSKEMAKKMRISNYFPRIYDEQLLASKTGREQFINTFINMRNWTEEQLLDTIEAMVGKKSVAKQYLEMAKKRGGRLSVDRNMAESLFNARKNFIGGSSTHLDHQRKFHLGRYDELMEQFRIREPDKILDRYLNDVYTRIEHARIFGAKHEGADDLFSRIEAEVMDLEARKYAKDVYFTQVNDAANSRILEGYVNAPEWVKTLNGKVAAFEVFKLAYSQILQPTQAFVNGTAMLSRQMSITQSFGTTLRSLQKAMQKDPIFDEFTQRAASGFNVGLIDHLSEASAEATLFGRSQFATNKLKWINSPSGFLKFIKFMDIEKFTQKWATIQGHAYIENLLSKKAQIEDGLITNPKVIDRVRTLMDEMGFDWTKSAKDFSPNSINVVEKHRAAMRFNRAVNFTDGARQLAHAYRSPYASMFRMYKTFSYRQSGFLNDVLFQEMKKGNFRPAAVYLSAAAPAGWTVNQIRDFLKADDREYSNTMELMRALSMAGGIGYAAELSASALKSDYAVMQSLIGPGPSDIGRALHALPDLAAGNWKPLANAAYRATPQLPFNPARSTFEKAGIIRERRKHDPNKSFKEELFHMWKIIDADKKKNKKGDMDLSLDIKLDLGME